MTIDNIIRLAELQDRGDLDPATEEAIALAYADRHAADSRYVAAWARWLHHDGARWNLDSTLHAFNRARALCREAALQCNGSRTVAAVASAKAVAAVVRLAMSDRRLAATVEQWDANPHLLTTTEVDGIAAATYDLTTGIGRAPDPLDYITKATACSAASPGTAHPKWSAFLARITASNEELQDFLQRYIGYCCTGYVTEHAFVFAYGTGANGKSTFINTIVRVLGSYATVADMNTFIASKSERHPTDLAKLCGARLVVAQETQRGRRWDEIKIKALTGGDKLTARFMRQDFFDFTPTFKLFITGNHKPRISSVDEAMRRRLLLAPFTEKIPRAERDAGLLEKLWGERAAILRWCLDGTFQWRQMGLAPPKIVREATDEYFRQQDTVGLWIEECTEPSVGQFTLLSNLFASWKSWCEDRNLAPGSALSLSGTLEDQGYERAREGHTGQRGFSGITIKRR
ncbi:MAG TPA: phage/plasmid primase, P4 family [Xanthobacteraceae bacterium]|nr:phage/plasmid primase, P4 family [Xanthobacteraceae bacterium]